MDEILPPWYRLPREIQNEIKSLALAAHRNLPILFPLNNSYLRFIWLPKCLNVNKTIKSEAEQLFYHSRDFKPMLHTGNYPDIYNVPPSLRAWVRHIFYRIDPTFEHNYEGHWTLRFANEVDLDEKILEALPNLETLTLRPLIHLMQPFSAISELLDPSLIDGEEAANSIAPQYVPLVRRVKDFDISYCEREGEFLLGLASKIRFGDKVLDMWGAGEDCGHTMLV